MITRWGGNILGGGGLFFGSNVANSCAITDCSVSEPGPHGDCEALRATLAERPVRVCQPNRLYWISDTTPHESLPLEQTTYRQFFRLVTSNVSHWFRKNSTANPFGIVPPERCVIVPFDKFEPWNPRLHAEFGNGCQALLETFMCAMYRLMDECVLAETDPALLEVTLESMRRCDVYE